MGKESRDAGETMRDGTSLPHCSLLYIILFKVDTITKLEAQAYSAFMRATLCVELSKWRKATELFKTVKWVIWPFSLQNINFNL